MFLGQFAPQLDGYIPAILLVAGVVLFLVEIFVMPGTFLFGIGGILCMILALALSFSPSEIPEYIPETVETTFDATPWLFGLLYMLCCAAVALVFPIAASKYLIPLLPEGWTPMLKTDLETAASPTEDVQEIAVGAVHRSRYTHPGDRRSGRPHLGLSRKSVGIKPGGAYPSSRAFHARRPRIPCGACG